MFGPLRCTTLGELQAKCTESARRVNGESGDLFFFASANPCLPAYQNYPPKSLISFRWDQVLRSSALQANPHLQEPPKRLADSLHTLRALFVAGFATHSVLYTSVAPIQLNPETKLSAVRVLCPYQ